MTSINFDYFDVLSNEVVVNVVGLLDLVSLYRFTGTSKRLYAFKQISNEQWRGYYAQKWKVEDKELAIYKVDNWQNVYFRRLKAESDYLSNLAKIPPSETVDQPAPDPTRNNGADLQQFLSNRGLRKQIKEDGTEENFYEPHLDPWALLLLEKHCDNPAVVKTYFALIDAFFGLPFTDEDCKREILSGRLEIFITAMSQYAANDPNLLVHLNLMEDFMSEDYKENRVRPYGLLGLLAKYLDMSTPAEVLPVVADVLWATVAADRLDEDFFVGLEIVQKAINVALKTSNSGLRDVCLAILSWFKPSKPENQKALVNAPFMKMLIDELFQEKPENFDTLPRLIITFGQFNLSVIEEGSIVCRMVELARKYGDKLEGMKKLLVTAHALCLYSNNCGTELAQHETALVFVLSLINDSKDEGQSALAEQALALIDSMARCNAGAERLFELNVIEKLLTLLEDPTNTHLFHDIYTTLHLLTDYANMNGFGDEIFEILLQHKDALIDRGDDSADVEVRNACNAFWMNFSCAAAPPRDVSIKLVERALPLVPTKTTLKVKKDAVLLLANIAEVDLAAFAGKDLTELFNYMAEYLINFDAEKERVELLRLEKEQEKEEQLKVGGVAAAEFPLIVEEACDNNVDKDTDMNDTMDVDNDSNSDSMIVEEAQPETVTECPWPLNLLAFLIRSENLQPIAIQNHRLMEKLFSLYDDERLVYEARFLAMYFFTSLIRIPGWDSRKALKYIDDFAVKAQYDVEWNFMFSKIEPYAHLLRKDNPTPMVIFGSWFLAHMSMTEPGRQILKKELDPEVLKWMKDYPHPRIDYNMEQFARNMKKKTGRN